MSIIQTDAVYVHTAKKSSQGINHARRFFSRVSGSRDVRKRMLGRRVAAAFDGEVQRLRGTLNAKLAIVSARDKSARGVLIFSYFCVRRCCLKVEQRSAKDDATARREIHLGRRFPTRYPDVTRIKNYNSRTSRMKTFNDRNWASRFLRALTIQLSPRFYANKKVHKLKCAERIHVSVFEFGYKSKSSHFQKNLARV